MVVRWLTFLSRMANHSWKTIAASLSIMAIAAIRSRKSRFTCFPWGTSFPGLTLPIRYHLWQPIVLCILTYSIKYINLYCDRYQTIVLSLLHYHIIHIATCTIVEPNPSLMLSILACSFIHINLNSPCLSRWVEAIALYSSVGSVVIVTDLFTFDCGWRRDYWPWHLSIHYFDTFLSISRRGQLFRSGHSCQIPYTDYIATYDYMLYHIRTSPQVL